MTLQTGAINRVIFGEGEMAELTRRYDWESTPLGPIETWPQSLVTTVNIVLNSRFPMLLWWGQDLIQIYNDTYRTSLGENGKHPSALGKQGVETWEEIWEIIKPLIDHVLSTGKPTWSEDQLVPIHRNGKLEDVYWTFGYSAVYDESGKVNGVLVVCNETTQKVITARSLEENQQQLKKALVSAESSEENLRNLIMQAPVAMCILKGRNYVVEIANEPICEIWGKKKEEVLDRPIFEGLPEAKDQGLEELLHAVYNTGERFSAYGHSVKLPRNGEIETVYLNFVYEALKNSDGSIAGVIAIATDVTSQVEARLKIEESEKKFRDMADVQRTFSENLEQKVAERTLELQKMNGELQNFAYVASHDLQEPLRKIQTYSDRLLEKEHVNLSDSGREYFRRMQSAASRMQALINDLLDYSRTNNTDLKAEPTNLNELVEEVMSEIKDVINEKKAIIEAGKLCGVFVIPYQFRQVIQNLIGNSLKFSKPDVPPVIRIQSEMKKGREMNETRLVPTEEYCHLSFQDNGIGFEQQYSSRIFEMFQRLNGRSEYEGTGIGLAIVNKIVENHKGVITATSEVGKGTTIDIYIPVIKHQ